MLTVLLPSQSKEAAVSGTAVTLTSTLDTSRQVGQAIYALACTTDSWYAQGIADTTFTVVFGTGIATAAGHKLTTGMVVQVSNSGGALPTGLVAATSYWAGVIDANTFYFYDTLAHAQAGGPTGRIAMSDNGTGTQTMTTTATVGNGSAYLPAGAMVPVDGALGAKVSVIQDSAGGKASITPCMVVR